MAKTVILLAAIIVLIAIIAAALFLLPKPKPAEASPLNSSVPILIYSKGLPYMLYNLSSGLEVSVGHGNLSSKFNYTSFKPSTLTDSVMYAASLNRSWGNASLDFLLKNLSFYFEDENNSFGSGSMALPIFLGHFDSENAILLGLRIFPLAYYSTEPHVALRSGLYPVYYSGNLSGISQFVHKDSTPGLLQYNVSRYAPVSFGIINTSAGYELWVNITNNWNRTLNLTEIELSGYFLGSESSNFTLPRVNVASNGDAYAITAISTLGINMNQTSTQAYLQTNPNAIRKFIAEANSDGIKNLSLFYSYFNSTLNVSRLNYLESLMLENQSYYMAMHDLDNFDPLNYSVVEYAGRISAWKKAYHGMLDFNVSENGTLNFPKSLEALNSSGMLISPSKSAHLVFDIGNLSYMGQSSAPIKAMNYTVLAYFNGVIYSDQQNP